QATPAVGRASLGAEESPFRVLLGQPLADRHHGGCQVDDAALALVGVLVAGKYPDGPFRIELLSSNDRHFPWPRPRLPERDQHIPKARLSVADERGVLF